MSESVSILIEADDQASKTFAESARNVAVSQKKVEQVLKSIESPIDRYNKGLAELQSLQKAGSINADQFALAQNVLKEKLEGTGNAVKEVGGKAKAATEFVGVLASVSGSPEIAGLANQLGGITEKVGQFSELSKAGGAGALAFKGGVLALAFGLGVTLGKALGDVIFQTAKFNRELERLKTTAGEIAAEMINLNNKTTELSKRDIELIRDPEAKEAAYKQLLSTLDRDVQQITANVKASEKAVEEWADSWKVTGERKAAAEMAEAELANDKERLKAVKAQRDAVRELTSERAKAAEALAAENAAKDKSESYVESLRLEVEYMKATREEQIKLDAARNTTSGDRGEAEALLKEKDAIVAKAEAEKKADDDRKQRAEQTSKAIKDAYDAVAKAIKKAADAAEEIRKKERAAADRIKADAAAEKKRVEDIVIAENQRLELRKIEIEQGKEAAKIQALVNQGVDRATAKQLAAKEAAIDAKTKREEPIKKSSELSLLSATEGRLITRGPSQSIPQQTLEEIRQLRNEARIAARERREDEQAARELERNKSKIVVAGAPA